MSEQPDIGWCPSCNRPVVEIPHGTCSDCACHTMTLMSRYEHEELLSASQAREAELREKLAEREAAFEARTIDFNSAYNANIAYAEQVRELKQRAEAAERLIQAARDFDAADDDAEFEAPHPIFMMAEDVDRLNAENAELRKLLEESKVPEETLIEIVTQAHMAGQFNQSQRDPSYYEARVYYGEKQLSIRAALAQPKEPKQ